MSAARHSSALWEKAVASGQDYDDTRRSGVSIELLHRSIRFSMRDQWGANRTATLKNVAGYAVFSFKLYRCSNTNSIISQAADRSRHKQSKNTNLGNHSTLLIKVARQRDAKSLSSSRNEPLRSLGLTKLQANSRKIGIMPHEHVALITLILQAPLQYGSR